MMHTLTSLKGESEYKKEGIDHLDTRYVSPDCGQPIFTEELLHYTLDPLDACNGNAGPLCNKKAHRQHHGQP